MPQKEHFHLGFATTMCLVPKVVRWEVRKIQSQVLWHLSHTQHRCVALLPELLTQGSRQQCSSPASLLSWLSSLLPSSFSQQHISNSSTDFRVGAMSQFASGESRDLWECNTGSKRSILWQVGDSESDLPKQRLVEMGHFKEAVMSQFLPTVD